MPTDIYSEDDENPREEAESVNSEHELKANAQFLFKVSKSTDKLASVDKDNVLPLKAGDIVVLLSARGEDGWWYGEKIGKSQQKEKGHFHHSNVSQLVTSNPDVSSFEIPSASLSFDRGKNFLGRGGFGQVYAGYFRDLKVAVKIPNSNFSQSNNDESILKKLKKEAYIQHHLNHENIVKLLKISLDNPMERCLVLEFCAGGSLTPVLYHREVPPRVLIEWALQITRGMQYLHYRAPIPILHKDLKSGNILFSQEITLDDSFENKTLKITDFGLAKPIEYHSQSQSNCQGGGTVEWMAPEVIKRSLYSHASDSWSFGVVLWELLIGQAPYKNLQYHTVLYKIGEHNLTLPIPAKMEPGFANLMRGCWDISVSSRLTFNQIEQELMKILEMFHNNFHMSGEDFVKSRERDWYPDIKYDYMTDYGGSQAITQNLVEELIQAHKEKRDAQLRLAEKELKEALQFQSFGSDARKSNKIKNKQKIIPGLDISFPMDVRHNISVKDDLVWSNIHRDATSSEMTSQASFASNMHYSNKAGVLSSPMPNINYSTWSGRGARQALPLSPGLFDESGPGSDLRSESSDVDSTADRVLDSRGSKSQSESNILAISNGSVSSTHSNESQMSNSDSIGLPKKSLGQRILRRISRLGLHRKKSIDQRPAARRTDTAPFLLKGPTESFTKPENAPKNKYPVIVDSARILEHTPEKIIKISDQGSSGPNRPTNLDLSYVNRSPISNQGNYSSYGEDFDWERNTGEGSIFSPSRSAAAYQFGPPVNSHPNSRRNLSHAFSPGIPGMSVGGPCSYSHNRALTPNNNSSFLFRNQQNYHQMNSAAHHQQSPSASPMLLHHCHPSPHTQHKLLQEQQFFAPDNQLSNYSPSTKLSRDEGSSPQANRDFTNTGNRDGAMKTCLQFAAFNQSSSLESADEMDFDDVSNDDLNRSETLTTPKQDDTLKPSPQSRSPSPPTLPPRQELPSRTDLGNVCGSYAEAPTPAQSTMVDSSTTNSSRNNNSPQVVSTA